MIWFSVEHLSKKPWLAALRVKVGMPTEEWIEGGHLIPPRDQLCIGVAEEAAHVSTYIHQEFNASHGQQEAAPRTLHAGACAICSTPVPLQ